MVIVSFCSCSWHAYSRIGPFLQPRAPPYPPGDAASPSFLSSPLDRCWHPDLTATQREEIHGTPLSLLPARPATLSRVLVATGFTRSAAACHVISCTGGAGGRCMENFSFLPRFHCQT